MEIMNQLAQGHTDSRWWKLRFEPTQTMVFTVKPYGSQVRSVVEEARTALIHRCVEGLKHLSPEDYSLRHGSLS
jgi:hypothetical protein